jgi:two-component system CheB/CheR fusion protein
LHRRRISNIVFLASRGKTRESPLTLDPRPTRSLQEASLLASAESLRFMIESLGDHAISMLDRLGRVATWNAMAERVQGYSGDEVVGRSFEIFHAPEDVKAGKPEELLRRAAEEGKAEDAGPRVRKDGTRFEARVVMTALRDEGGALQGFALVTRDVTALKRAEEDRLRLAIEEARARDASHAALRRDELLAIVSHDLRTPLGVIAMNATLLAKNAPEGDRGQQSKRWAESALRAADRMARLINDLVDTASIEAGRLRVEPRREDAVELVREAIESLSVLSARKSIVLDAELPQTPLPETPLFVWCDRERVHQVLVNLVGNSMKFTPREGSIGIRVERTGDHVTFHVRDTGSGIAPDRLDHIFERGGRAKPAAGGGLGLGLFISKGIVDAHRGRIWCESRVRGGTTVSFTLPTSPPPELPDAGSVRAVTGIR